LSNFSEIQISALNHYVYCPKRFYLCYINNEFVDNEYTIEGREIHNRSDSGLITRRKDLLQIRTVWLKSEKYNLIGKADLIEEKAGELYPVEYKRGKAKDWKNDQVQLMAQALCLEEMLGREKKIERGFVFYHLSNKREEIIFTEELRNFTIESLLAMRKLFLAKISPEASFGPKCPNCSMYPVCLPRETAKIREIINRKQIDDL